MLDINMILQTVFTISKYGQLISKDVRIPRCVHGYGYGRYSSYHLETVYVAKKAFVLFAVNTP